MVAIVNMASGSWYPRGAVRLRRHFADAGYPLEFKAAGQRGDFPYEDKIRWVLDAMSRHDAVLWMDCSVVPLLPVQEWVSYIQSHALTRESGVYAYKTGMTLGETCNDAAFDMSGLGSEYLASPEFASTVFYLDTKHAVGNEIAHTLEALVDGGAARGSRSHEPSESSRKEFRFHRQDQTCLTLAMHKAGVDPGKADCLWDVVKYADDDRSISGKWALIAGGEENLKCYPSASEAA